MHNVLRRLSIRAKLTAGFGVLTIVTTLLGPFCLRQMGAMNDAAEIVRGNSLPSMLGLALNSAWTADAGTDMDLPGATGAVHGRVVRSGSGVLAAAFRQDTATLAGPWPQS